MARIKRPSNSVPEREQRESGSNVQREDQSQVTQTDSDKDKSSNGAGEGSQSVKKAKSKGKRPTIPEKESKRLKSTNETDTSAKSGKKMFAGRVVKAVAVKSKNFPGPVKKQKKDVSKDLDPDSEDTCKGFMGKSYDADSDDSDGNGGGGETHKNLSNPSLKLVA